MVYTLYFDILKKLILLEDIGKLKRWITINGFIYFPEIDELLYAVKNEEIKEYIRGLPK